MKGLRVVLVLGLAVVGVSAGRADLIDQQQLDGSVYMAAFSQTDLAQSFQSQTASNISGASIMTQAGVGGGDVITIAVWDALPNAGGNMLASGSVGGVTPGSWAEVHWAPVPIVDNTTYYLVFTSDTNTMGIAGALNNPYPFGNVFANAGYNPFPNFDYAFQTFTIPEPAALLLIGLAGLFIRRR